MPQEDRLNAKRRSPTPALGDQTTTDETPIDLGPVGQHRGWCWRLHLLVSPDESLAGTVVDLAGPSMSLGRQHTDLQVADSLLSRHHLELWPDAEGVTVVDERSRNGTFLAGQRVSRARASHGAVLRFGQTVAVLEADGGAAQEFAEPVAAVPGFSEQARKIRRDLANATRHGHHLLLLGETGTGKEHAAGEFHRLLKRTGPLVRFNVSAVPADLFEAELFGHAAGAYTGASKARVGRIQEAHRGTLVLDEIGELSLELQPKLLRVLEEARIRPVGASRDVPVDVRFVAATNADLATMAAHGTFRPDLLARLSADQVHLPKLKERRADLLELADAVQPLAPAGQRLRWRHRLSAQAAEALLLAPWPYNLRTLRSVLARAVTAAGHEAIALTHLPPEMQRAHAQRTQAEVGDAAVKRPAAAELRKAFGRHAGSVDLVAKAYAVHRKQVYRWLGYAGIPLEEIEALRGPGKGQG